MKYQPSIAALTLGAMTLVFSTAAVAQDDEPLEEIVVTGIRGSLAAAVDQKRDSDQLVEVIIAEDIGKLPDQNLAEVLENITGIQITRTAGVGTGVQIRGTNSNRVEFNGVSTVNSGSGRSGINFEDVNPAIISAVEVTKSPDARTIEGSVGGTINLKTIRPLDLPATLGAVRVQYEDSSLSSESMTPRFSGAFGDNWSTGAGEVGFVISGSVTEQESVSFRPRTDRDNRVSPAAAVDPSEFLGIQFLVQEQENYDYDTVNLASTFEWAPSDSLKFHADIVINEQERSQDSYRLQASGVSTLRNLSVPTAYETVDFGVGPGRFPAALQGTLEPDLANDDDDPNLRFSSDTGSRVTDSQIIALGGEWNSDRWSVSAEYAMTTSDTSNPNLSTTLNFINPNCPLDGSSNDNCVPFIYDLSGGTLSWGVNYDSPFAPAQADLLDPANVVLDQVIIGRNTTENEEDAFRMDFSWEADWNGITTLDFGFRYGESSSRFNRIQDRIGGFSRMVDSPNGVLFSELLVPGPSNFDKGDGRTLFIRDFLLVDPDRAFSDPDGTLAILEAAVVAHDPVSPDTARLASDRNQFYDVSEETTALYAQANFQAGIFRGNVGVRYVETEVDSVAYGFEDAAGNRSLESTKGKYDFLLPRLNVAAEVSEDVIVRFGYGSDIRRPGFNRISTAFAADNQENSAIDQGNPNLKPEEVDSLDLAVEWYFADSALVSLGYFTKDRTDIIGQVFEGALLVEDASSTSGLARETDPSCPGGGIWNPTVIPNVLGDPNRLGLCVDYQTWTNDPSTTTQSGFEFAFQYDLSGFEDRLGWASGFGVIFNYTNQDFSGGSIVDCTSGRGAQVLGSGVCIPRGLLDFSEDAYNITIYYEKYGLSARARYTWRESFRTQDFGGGANTSGSSTFSFPVHTLDRGQLNASINYSVNDHLDVGLEVVNLTEERIDQHCVSTAGPLCFVGLPDRRIVVGGIYRF
ncbi:MAG: TonB-dependent receptor [Gammaproteobacteria bacterium]|nr:TonB-dependent receptor [Gammaproteobacteria bacterium]MXW44631.1 TonB-dependent receptor [Gammaproteobacteria bacterium]MYD02328.1 TonB-dependent receptor [Gammaproteobacteria bacterium]MYI24792.1 TonB-dependent receptor [Gammaproteobacteria bacterium]